VIAAETVADAAVAAADAAAGNPLELKRHERWLSQLRAELRLRVRTPAQIFTLMLLNPSM
jgi:hypothetical protein